MADAVVVDSSALVDLLIGSPLADAVHARLTDRELHAPSHVDAEALSAIGRLSRAGRLPDHDTETIVDLLASTPLYRHELPSLLSGAWRRRHNLRLVDALYVELSAHLGGPVVTTDRRLAAAAPEAELLTAEG